MKIVLFCDTNLLIQLSKKLLHDLRDNEVDYYVSVCQKITCVISSYVVFEIRKTLCKRYGIPVDKLLLIQVLEETGFHILQSPREIDFQRYGKYVMDIDDTQILVDTITSQATILFTRNVRDFAGDKIYQDFGILITNNIQDFL